MFADKIATYKEEFAAHHSGDAGASSGDSDGVELKWGVAPVQAHCLGMSIAAGGECTQWFRLTSQRVLVEACAHISGYRTRTRLRLRLRG